MRTWFIAHLTPPVIEQCYWAKPNSFKIRTRIPR